MSATNKADDKYARISINSDKINAAGTRENDEGVVVVGPLKERVLTFNIETFAGNDVPWNSVDRVVNVPVKREHLVAAGAVIQEYDEAKSEYVVRVFAIAATGSKTHAPLNVIVRCANGPELINRMDCEVSRVTKNCGFGEDTQSYYFPRLVLHYDPRKISFQYTKAPEQGALPSCILKNSDNGPAFEFTIGDMDVDPANTRLQTVSSGQVRGKRKSFTGRAAEVAEADAPLWSYENEETPDDLVMYSGFLRANGPPEKKRK